jgi:hypothetical protein
VNTLPKEKKKGLPVKFRAGRLDCLSEQLEDIIGPLTIAAPSVIFRTSILIMLIKALGADSLAVSLHTILNISFA